MRSIWIAAIVLLTGISVGAQPQSQPLSVAVAANMVPAMEDIRKGFLADTGVDLALTPGASGKFAAQIANGAPFDVFISADMDYPEKLFKDGFTARKPDRYAAGTLILWTLKDVDVSKGLSILADPAVQKIAVADPKTAPYGTQAVAALKAAGLYDRLAGKLVYGDSISQTNQFVTSLAADAGFVARSIVETEQWKGKGHWIEVSRKLYKPIDQALVVLKPGADKKPALQLRDFILGKKGRAILKRYGYDLP
jgi:molybdate transport system substrate-binding protein